MGKCMMYRYRRLMRRDVTPTRCCLPIIPLLAKPPPAAPATLSLSVLRDFTRQFSWVRNTAEADVAGYQIRYSATLTDEWEEMSLLHDGFHLLALSNRPAQCGYLPLCNQNDGHLR